jgi:hypothetical protein
MFRHLRPSMSSRPSSKSRSANSFRRNRFKKFRRTERKSNLTISKFVLTIVESWTSRVAAIEHKPCHANAKSNRGPEAGRGITSKQVCDRTRMLATSWAKQLAGPGSHVGVEWGGPVDQANVPPPLVSVDRHDHDGVAWRKLDRRRRYNVAPTHFGKRPNLTFGL